MDDSPIDRFRAALEANRRANPGPAVAPGPAAGPGLAALASNFLGAFRAFVRDRARFAPRSVRARRRAACLACPHHDPAADACGLCGCGSVIPGGLAAKRAIASSACPDDPPRFEAC